MLSFLSSIYNYIKNYLSVTHFVAYRINGKHIILGTVHCNSYLSLHHNIKKEINKCEFAYFESESILSFKDNSELIIQNLNSSTEDKILNLTNIFKEKDRNGKRNNTRFFPEDFLNKMNEKYPETIDWDYEDIHYKILKIYTIDSYLNLLFKNNCDYLDSQEDVKKICSKYSVI